MNKFKTEVPPTLKTVIRLAASWKIQRNLARDSHRLQCEWSVIFYVISFIEVYQGLNVCVRFTWLYSKGDKSIVDRLSLRASPCVILILSPHKKHLLGYTK